MNRFGASLRLKITALALLALLALIAIGIAAQTIRERQFAAAMAAAVQQDARLLWRATLGDGIARLDRAAGRIAADPAVAAALARPERGGLAAALAPHLDRLAAESGRGRIELIGPEGGLLFNSGGELFWRPTLTGAALPPGGGAVDAVQLDWGRAAVLAHGLRLPGRSGAILVVSGGIEPLLAEMKAGTEAEAFLVNRRARLLAGTRPGLWERIAAASDDTPDAPRREIRLDGRTLAVTTLPLDPQGGLTARLVLVRDVSREAGGRLTLQALSLGLAMLATLLVVGGLWLWLRRMFRPLEHSVAAINALSAGDTSVSIAAHGLRDEIGRMAEALERFRANMGTLTRLQAAERRQRRRQERFIHREMTALAGTLDPLAREEILRDLSELEDGDDQSGLGVTAAAFRRMSVRVRQQQQHLQELIGELREALKMQAAYLQLQQELDIARQIQRSMLPVNFPTDHPRIALYAEMEPAKEVGGDFYDFFFLDERRLGMVIADVSGKGVPAALFMAIARTLLKATALFGSPPARCLANLNNLLAENNEKDLFVTVFYGILDLDSGVFTYCNAGHNPPYLLPADGPPRPLPRTGGAALAILADLPQRDATVALAPGDGLFLFTDGVTEAQDAGGGFWGEARLEATLAAAGRSPHDLIGAVYDGVRGFVADAPQFDDITCLAVRWHPGG
ncbi:MAG: hypothetical protein RLZZ501_1331 [Pseudomonadota bacterium]|jgi:sigma-B regulation protein RsbU (phosphoserine phosphatase)